MAYFECIIGGAGTTLTVTCDSVFAGKTITCTNGTTTLTAVCPSASPYVVEFDVETDGTWTISGTVNGKTHSMSMTINTSGELHEIPTGSSVTPVANVQTWLHCANIWNKSYTTIAQVLADASTLQALIASNNAADYMARSTSWASAVTANSSAMTYIGANNYCANKLLANSTWLNAICNSTYMESVLNVKVPTMTSNTAPYGEASATKLTASTQAYMAFDGNSNTKVVAYQTGATNAQSRIQYKFVNPICVNAFDFVGNLDAPNLPPTAVQLQGSNDGTNWVNIGDKKTSISADTNKKSYTVNNDNYYLYICLLCDMRQNPGTNNYYAQFSSLQFYGRA